MALFSKKDKEDNTEKVKNPLEEIQGNKDFSGKTFVQKNDFNQVSPTDKKMTNISAQTSVEGILKIDGDITINGKVKGSITAKGQVTIEQQGIVEGDILAQKAEISGKVVGKVEISEILALRGTAKINGDIFTDKLIIEQEASFNGKCVMGKNPSANTNIKPNVNNEKQTANASTK